MVDAAGRAVKPAAAALRERRPRKGSHWVEVGGPTIGDCPVSYWKRSGVTVISTLELAELPGQPDRMGLQWHVSASYKADRPSAEHDNHERRPVHRLATRAQCLQATAQKPVG
jgi:hypothetical protein